MACIVDIQGFQFKTNPFICKELAIKEFDLQKNCCHHIKKFVFNYPVIFEYLRSDIKKQIEFLMHKKHGFHWHSTEETPFLHSYTDFGKIIQSEIIDKNYFLVMVKGEQKLKWLENFLPTNLISIVNLEKYGCPAINKLKNEEISCNFHCSLHCLPGKTCGVENVQLIYNWLKNANLSLPIYG